MSRPKPDIITSRPLDPQGIKACDLLEADAVWTVKYEGQFINLRTRNTMLDYPGPKYPRVSFSNEGAAHLLCRKLRKKFRDPNFFVYKLTGGERMEDRNGGE